MIDLIDMAQRKHQNAVYRALRESLKRDKARTNVLPISKLGILEMSRQRVEESILASLFENCPYCGGRGHIRSALTMSVEVQRQIGAAMRRSRSAGKVPRLQILVHPSVRERFKKEDEEVLLALQAKVEGHLGFKAAPTMHQESFAIYDADSGELLHSTDRSGVRDA